MRTYLLDSLEDTWCISCSCRFPGETTTDGVSASFPHCWPFSITFTYLLDRGELSYLFIFIGFRQILKTQHAEIFQIELCEWKQWPQ